MRNIKLRALLIIATLFAFASSLVVAQSITTGDLSGTVTDSSGAVVSGATVTVRDLATGATRTVVTNTSGVYRVSLLKPGQYEISASGSGLTSSTFRADVGVGQARVVNLTAKPQGETQSVEVTTDAPLLNTENGDVTTNVSQKQMSILPTPGGDITTLAFTTPGVIVSTGAGYGGFSSFGLPANSNLFTMNGNDNMDPYLNLNNSGASNLTLGGSEVQEAVVVQNGYSGQYGRQAGAQVNYITKSGSNGFHGSAQYLWNGSVLNANDWFNNNTGTPKGKANSNQWAASIGGPIKKDKLFFFYSTEGLRYILPSSGTVAVPSAQLQQYILGHVSPAQQAFYQQAFNLYNNAPGLSRAIPVVGVKDAAPGPLQDNSGALGCGSLAGTAAPGGGIFGTDVSCANAYNTNVSNLNKEWLQTGRVDWNVSDKQKVFFRYKEDHGLQPTFTDPINPAFNVQSNQPQWEGQFNHTYVLTPNSVNNFIFSANYYSAIFSPSNLSASIATFPNYLQFFDGGANGANFGGAGFTNLGVNFGSFPQGRKVSQYAFVDDFSTTQGKHSIKFGANFRRDNVTDTSPLILQNGRYRFFDLNDFASGTIDNTTGSNYNQRFAAFDAGHIALYSLGLYIQDEWAVKSNLKLTFALRGDINDNPKCNGNCFARLNNTFSDLTKGDDIPYNQSITTGLSTAFPSVEAVALQPRIGFSYSPFGSQSTVLRGGIGIFSDLFPGTLASSVFLNSPNVFTPNIRTGQVNSSGAGSSADIAVATNEAFQNGFSSGLTRAQMAAALAAVDPTLTFTPPAYFAVPDKLLNPKYLEWNFELQQSIGKNNVISLNYVGNHGYNLFIENAKVNAFTNGSLAGFGNAGIPSAAPDPRFRIVTQLSNTGTSNYDGLVVSYRRNFKYGLQGHLSYTWSHALDDISNGGVGEFFNANDSLTSQLDPTNLRRLNYSDADYDIRHNLVGDFVWELPFKFSNPFASAVLGNWSLGGKYYWRSGTPFSVFNSSLPGEIGNTLGGAVLAQVVNPNLVRTCLGPNDPCFSNADFADDTTQVGFGNVRRNSFRGPHYQDADFSLQKRLFQLEKVGFSLGANIYNVFNHPNFASPGQDMGTTVGAITSTVSPPSSPYGSFQGSAVSGRVIQFSGKLTF
jgi:hypothetical protein